MKNKTEELNNHNPEEKLKNGNESSSLRTSGSPSGASEKVLRKLKKRGFRVNKVQHWDKSQWRNWNETRASKSLCYFQEELEKAIHLSHNSCVDDVLKVVEDMNIELLFTDIKDKDGKKFELSDEFMEIISHWWDKKSLELTQKLKEMKQ